METPLLLHVPHLVAFPYVPYATECVQIGLSASSLPVKAANKLNEI